jgi:ParB-like chromosome segregation protein Spo0J
VDIDWHDIGADPLNANRGTERGGKVLRDSIAKRGISKPPLVDANNIPIAGSKTLEAAMEAGFTPKLVDVGPSEILIARRADLDVMSRTDPRGRELSIADNRVAELNLDHATEMIEAAAKYQGSQVWEELWYQDERVDAISADEVDELMAESDAAGAEADPIKIGEIPPTKYVVIVTCKDDTEQAELIDLCEERGWRWRNP